MSRHQKACIVLACTFVLGFAAPIRPAFAQGCPEDCADHPDRISATIEGLTAAECTICEGFGPPWNHKYCTQFNADDWPLTRTDCEWWHGITGGYWMTLSCASGLWTFSITGNDVCASWTAESTSTCPPATGWTWAGGCCGEGTLTLDIVTVDLDIAGLSDDEEDAPGGLVVRRHDGNDAPRQEIILRKAEPEDWDGDVVLSRSNTRVKVFDAAEGGNEITFNGTDNKFANADLPESLYVQGHTASAAMRDVTLELYPETETACKDSVTFTVLWVDTPTVKYSSADSVSDDNDKRDNYKGWTVANTYHLGLQEYDQDYGARMGWGTEAGAAVYPPDFDYAGNNLKLERDVEFHDWIGNGGGTISSGTFSQSIPPGNDTGPAGARDDNPAPNDNIYDWDAPGLAIPEAPKDQIRRTRNNFKAFASITVQGTAVRCSLVKEYFVRFSMKQLDDPTGSNWAVVDPPDVAGDKQAGYGSTKLSWNLE